MPGVQYIDAAKYHSFLGIKPDKGEEVTTASAGTLAQAPKDPAAHGYRACSCRNHNWC